MSWPQNGRKNVLVLSVELRKIVVQVVNTICVNTDDLPPPPQKKKGKKKKKKKF